MYRRSLLYVPANNEKMIRKSTQIASDAIIFDLEDAVPLSKKDEARGILFKLVNELSWGERELIVRVNTLTSKLGLQDLIFLTELEKVNAVIVPKSADKGEIEIAYKVTGKEIIPLIETSKGILNVENIARAEGVKAIAYATADLALDVGGEQKRYSRNEYIKTKIILIAKSYGLDGIDQVFFDLSDLQGLEREAREAKELGYTGKQVIHPSQVEVVNGVFSPNQQELEWAEKIIKAYKENIALGKGAIRLEDKLVDAVHVRQAIKILERAGKRINLD